MNHRTLDALLGFILSFFRLFTKSRLWQNTSGAVKFDIFGIAILTLAIWVADYVGPMFSGYFGGTTGILSTIITGFLIYVIWALISGKKINIITGVFFVVAVWLSGYIVTYVSGSIGALSGWILMLFQAIIISFILSFIGPSDIKQQVPARAT